MEGTDINTNYNNTNYNRPKREISAKGVLLSVATYLAFALGFWYGARGTAAGLASSIVINDVSVLANEVIAALLGGIIPFALFELAVRFYLRPLARLGISMDKPIVRLRLFFMCACVVCFAASLVYLAYPFLSVWGGILLNFCVLFAALILYFVFETRRMEDKTKTPYFVMQIGTVFLFVYGLMTVLSVVMELL